ncbi:uncharacterized protein LOC131886165 isoform X1 [Tigriopus californicus]|uniref:uncharacterized protein LOC131886165 isoform X1 n=1 Tax=Tigriopus californicus TaxID=6832 RepID=UPI0027DA2360|nr:uncharacterized protein LOC131886165 isoform X1 [Tigriopus californicus]
MAAHPPRHPPQIFNEYGEPIEAPPAPTKGQKLLKVLGSICSFLFSHIGLLSLVVGYCFLGAFIFEELERYNEIEVKRNMTRTREAVTESLWHITRNMQVLRQDNWTAEVVNELRTFEKNLIIALKERGWDGSEDESQVNWTFAGSLFYSITVITTIGYGHIAPKTAVAKIVTIFYAIMGIPLTVLCWSNIGDAMANAFRFCYWRIFCYLCTKKPRKRRRRPMSRPQRSMSMRSPARGQSLRRSQRTSQKSDDTARTDSTLSYSEAERCYEESMNKDIIDKNIPTKKNDKPRDLDMDMANQNEMTPAPEKKMSTASKISRGLGLRRSDRESQKSQKSNHSMGMDSVQSATVSGGTLPNRGLTMRQFSAPNVRLDRVPEDDWLAADPYYYDDYYSEDEQDDYSRKSVPIWLSLLLVVAYIVWGSYIFRDWEGWSLLDSAYFCFITLTTIGFGDLVPNQQSEDGEVRIALCSLYLLFGIAMIAMSFNLVQEQVINNVKDLGKQLGILKDDDEDEDY